MALFPKLKIKAPKMAHHDLSHYFRTSMAPGTLVPIACFPVVPGDDVQMNYESLINTQALLSPLYGSYKLQIDTFFAGSSLYIPKLWRNGSMQQTDGTLDANYPYFQFPVRGTGGVSATLIDPSSVFSYLGLPPWYGNKYMGHTDSINAIPWLMYIDIYRHYYVNRRGVFPFTLIIALLSVELLLTSKSGFGCLLIQIVLLLLQLRLVLKLTLSGANIEKTVNERAAKAGKHLTAESLTKRFFISHRIQSLRRRLPHSTYNRECNEHRQSQALHNTHRSFS